MKYIHIKGIKYDSFVYFKRMPKEHIEFTTVVSDYIYGKINPGKIIELGDIQVFIDGTYEIGGVDVIADEVRDATSSEISYFNKVLKENNLQFKYIESIRMPLLCWIEKDKMPMSLNGKLINLEDFYKMSFDDDTKVTLSYDNGFSYCGVETESIKYLYRMLDKMFSPRSDDRILHDGRVHTGRVYGWRFGWKGELIVNTTKENIHYSEVSDT